jgi:hypothetical protein
VGRIEVDPGQLDQAASLITGAAVDAAALPGIAASAAGAASEPSQTARALERLGTSWESGAAILDTELDALARSAEAAAFFYRQADTRSMGGP